MAVEEWEPLYRDYSSADLAAEITSLKAQKANMYATQNVGSKGYSKDLRLISEQLTAATKVKRERLQTTESRVGLADFSETEIS
jgi:hypothetical protein